MAASCLYRGYLSRATGNFYKILYSPKQRLFSSDQTGKGSDSSSEQDQKTELKPEVTADVPAADNLGTPSRRVAGEAAVDKFFKVVEKVRKSQEKSLDSESTEDMSTVVEDPNESFASMLRKSKLISLGEPNGRLVEGRIVEVMGDDLYIDFGGKFHCVCPRPKLSPESYHRGAAVMISLHALEMSSAFLGSDIHVTLLEADGTLLGLAKNFGGSSMAKF